jgi:HlyD family secretion protein
MWSTLKGFLTPPIVIGATVVVALVAIGIAFLMTDSQPSATYVTPTMGPLVQEVDSTGSVNAAQEIDLGFQTGGTIANAGPAVGTHVGAGATLGALRAGTQQAAVEQAQAALAIQQADLSSLQAGTRPESIAVSQTAVTNAQASLLAVAQDAYGKSYTAIDNVVDQFISNSHSSNPTLNFNLSNSQDQESIISGRIQMESLLNTWQAYLASLPSDPTQIDDSALASTTQNYLEQVSSYLNIVATGLTEAVPNNNDSTAIIQTYETNVATARTSVSTDLSSIDSAAAALATAQSQLTLAQAPATSQSLQAQEAQVASAQASVDAATAQLGQTVISAPISGTITVNSMEPGEIAAAGQTQISMISDTAFQFVTYVSEADLAELKTGDAALVQLDAYQNAAPLAASVIQIEPAATVQNGIASYKVTLQFNENDTSISSGETGNAKITTQSLQNVLSIPTSAIIMSNGQYFVIKKTPSGDTQVPVEIGVQSANGFTQITSGLSATDQVRTFGDQ